MMCKDCKDFHTIVEPIKTDGCAWDLGVAKCDKYSMVIDFTNHRKLNKLECVRGEADG